MVEGIRLFIRYALSELRPTPERLRQIVAGFGRWGYSEIYVDWGDSFPWGLDERFHASDAYPEDFVSGLARESAERGTVLNTVFPAPDALGFTARVGSYRRLFRSESTGPILDLETPAGRSFYDELIEDYLRLLPDARAILIDCRPRAAPPSLLARAVEPFRAQGLRVGVLYAGSAAELGEHLPPLVEGFDFVALPMSDAVSRGRSGSVIAAVSTPSEREAIVAGRGEGDLPLLVSFQGERRAAGAGPLGEAIERWLPEVRDTAERLGAVMQARAPGSGGGVSGPIEGLPEIDRRLGEALAEGWRLVRLVREALRDGGESPRALLVSLAAAYRAAADRSQELRRSLDGIVDAHRLDRVLGRLLGALFEEHFELCGRAGVAVHVETPETPGHSGRLATDPFSC